MLIVHISFEQMKGEPEIVRNFLMKTLRLQAWEKRIDCFTLGEGVMPASFKVLHDPVRNTDTMIADFGESAIGRVAPGETSTSIKELVSSLLLFLNLFLFVSQLWMQTSA
jgi:hypothetical protein